MMVSLLCLALKYALITLSLVGSHSRNVLAFYLAITRATPRICVSLCPEYSLVEQPWVICRLDTVHRHSLTHIIPSLYIFISRVTCANFEVSLMVRPFHAPMQILVLGPTRLSYAKLPS